jgi:hypothetical protein
MRTNHLVELTGLTKGTKYHYRIVSEGANGLVAISGDFAFRTRARIYVNVSSVVTEELGTIEAPYKTLQAAAEAAKETGDDILVAGGTYTGSSSEGVLELVGNGYDLTIQGGYSSDFFARDFSLHATVIDGEMQRRGIWLDNGAGLDIRGFIVQGCTHPDWGGGVVVRKGARLGMSACIIRSNASIDGAVNDNGGGVYATLGSSAALDDCLIVDNYAGSGGGVVAVSDDTEITLLNCAIISNRTRFSGGGMWLALGSTGILTNCLVAGNSSVEASGGGIEVSPFCEITLSACTIAGNRITDPDEPEYDGGGGMRLAGSSSGPVTATIENCIAYGNESQYGNDLRVRGVVDVHLAYSCFGDILGELTSSNHLIRAAPLYANPAAGDFHLLYGSPCIDSGDPAYYDTALDMDGEPRPFGGLVDMGADEFTDIDGDHMADYWEANAFGDLTTSDGTTDGDNDTLEDFDEYMKQTDPYDADTDHDLAQDGWEVDNGFDPLDPDMDGDGMWDGWEVAHALNAFTNDAALNPDDDPMDNLAEFEADTDPLDASSFLSLSRIERAWGGTRLDWKGGRDSVQYLEASPSLSSTNWTAIYAVPPPTPPTHAVVVFGETSDRLFYRIRVER